MAPKFGTSGLRGLVTELTADLVGSYTRAFLAACPTGGAVHVGWDLRPSSPEIAEAVISAITAAGQTVIVDGALPTPALALASLKAGQGAVMITGSHIPADRNGLKFYTPQGEISKADEAAILANLETPAPAASAPGRREDVQGVAIEAYVARYAASFGPEALAGLRVGIYQHSSVARDIMVDVVTALGGVAVALARSDMFIPVDTEAVDPETRSLLAGWCVDNGLDALISTDGDADRPMVADKTGGIVPGDVLGALSARMLGADTICTPVSSNTMVAQMPEFTALHRTRIGSPFVIAAMEEVLTEAPGTKVVGYEANGGFLLGFEASGPAGLLSPLMTRDCLLPMLAPLSMARAAGQPLADLVAALPPRFTAADRLTGIAPEASGLFLEKLRSDAGARADFFEGTQADVDLTDGLRLRFEDGDVVHLRPSGNAPEFRCYTEANSAERAQALLDVYLNKLRAVL
ncbi:phosphomannomutase [Marinovum sp. 2_MG-2023]|uniref:phosphomannomutase n=1 Tax=unclassified Marinovum TaxID=2647166 RepID=UPI0026E12238|nr:MULTISPECIES: phosphomannomutase [unclassified Marinovum]MDO6732122.1 phosphomannomutase [Marinovum sp. 2_MG-2023]MDO6781437.1 phosphomannomutase [Marinovum sp. 1_MG-2023]